MNDTSLPSPAASTSQFSATSGYGGPDRGSSAGAGLTLQGGSGGGGGMGGGAGGGGGSPDSRAVARDHWEALRSFLVEFLKKGECYVSSLIFVSTELGWERREEDEERKEGRTRARRRGLDSTLDSLLLCLFFPLFEMGVSGVYTLVKEESTHIAHCYSSGKLKEPLSSTFSVPSTSFLLRSPLSLCLVSLF